MTPEYINGSYYYFPSIDAYSLIGFSTMFYPLKGTWSEPIIINVFERISVWV